MYCAWTGIFYYFYFFKAFSKTSLYV
uniref:Uncharacterized protein n=1 Tax=Anguilla anguilla TaxID=7936 RepID=A0A0E9XQC9_ANGAN